MSKYAYTITPCTTCKHALPTAPKRSLVARFADKRPMTHLDASAPRYSAQVEPTRPTTDAQPCKGCKYVYPVRLSADGGKTWQDLPTPSEQATLKRIRTAELQRQALDAIAHGTTLTDEQAATLTSSTTRYNAAKGKREQAPKGKTAKKRAAKLAVRVGAARKRFATGETTRTATTGGAWC